MKRRLKRLRKRALIRIFLDLLLYILKASNTSANLGIDEVSVRTAEVVRDLNISLDPIPKEGFT